MGIAEVITAARSPWQNPYVERVIGTIPRELLAPSSCGASSFVILVHCFDGESRASSERGPPPTRQEEKRAQDHRPVGAHLVRHRPKVALHQNWDFGRRNGDHHVDDEWNGRKLR